MGPMAIVGAYVSNMVVALVITANYMRTTMGKFAYRF